MITISESELKTILDKHGRWLRSEPDGERADLSYADLGGANLSDANLSYADLSYADLSYADLDGELVDTLDFERLKREFEKLQVECIAMKADRDALLAALEAARGSKP